ncbi:MAG: alpha/beta fold hydrolase [Rhizobiaceae bacterium]
MVSSRKSMICIAGFGDNASMFDNLLTTNLSEEYDLRPLDLPGFGAQSELKQTTLRALADFVLEEAVRSNSHYIMAHSVASIIATLAAEASNDFIEEIISLEGNITAADAYFSGTAANFENALDFRRSFLVRLSEMSMDNDPILTRYSAMFEACDPLAAWQLGSDACAFSKANVPGERLIAAARVHYLFNPDNCPPETIDWLAKSEMKQTVLTGASHWPTIDQPHELVAALLG